VDAEAFLREVAIDFEHLERLVARLVGGGMRGVALLPEELAGAQEHARAHFPADDVGPLVDQHRQVAPRLDPARERGANDHFGGRADDQRLFELGLGVGDQAAVSVGLEAVVRDDGHFLGEPVDVLGLLLEVRERDEEREIAVFVAGRLDPVVEQALDPLPDAIAPGADDHAAADAGFLGEVGLGDDGLVPGGEIRLAGDGECALYHGVRIAGAQGFVTPSSSAVRPSTVIPAKAVISRGACRLSR
jgi:hypothetical protein